MQNPKNFQSELWTPSSNQHQEQPMNGKSKLHSLMNSSMVKVNHPILVDLPKKREREETCEDFGYKKQKLKSQPSSPTSEKNSLKPNLIDLQTHYSSLLERTKDLKSSIGKKLLPIAEYKRNNTTWDYLLAEME